MRLITRTSFIFIRKFIYVKFNYKGGEFSKFVAWSFAKIKRIYIGVIKKAAFALIDAAILAAGRRNRAAKKTTKATMPQTARTRDTRIITPKA